MAISTRTTDHPESLVGAGNRAGSGSRGGDAVQTELTADLQLERQHAEIQLAESVPLVSPEPSPTAVPEVPVQVVANQLGDVAVDAGRLLELQIRLFEAECVQNGRRLIEPVAILATTVILGIAAVAVVLLSLGTGLHELAGWPLSVSWLLAAVVGLATAGGAAWYAFELLKTPRISFEKSKEELLRNIAALSRVVKPQ